MNWEAKRVFDELREAANKGFELKHLVDRAFEAAEKISSDAEMKVAIAKTIEDLRHNETSFLKESLSNRTAVMVLSLILNVILGAALLASFVSGLG